MVWINNCSLNVINRPTYNCCLTQTDQNSESYQNGSKSNTTECLQEKQTIKECILSARACEKQTRL